MERAVRCLLLGKHPDTRVCSTLSSSKHVSVEQERICDMERSNWRRSMFFSAECWPIATLLAKMLADLVLLVRLLLFVCLWNPITLVVQSLTNECSFVSCWLLPKWFCLCMVCFLDGYHVGWLGLGNHHTITNNRWRFLLCYLFLVINNKCIGSRQHTIHSYCTTHNEGKDTTEKKNAQRLQHTCCE